MSESLKIAVCQINPVIGDIQYNKKLILEGYIRASASGADLAVFPEMALLGYPPLDLVEKREFREAVFRAIEEIAAASGKTGLIFGAIAEEQDTIGTNLFNSAYLCFEGKVRFIQHKTLLPNYDVFDEMRYFESAAHNDIFEFRGEKLGISICEDIWNDKDYWKQRLYPVDPVERQIAQGAQIIINISASPYSYGKREEKRDMLSSISQKYKVPLVYTCHAGCQTDLIFDGGSFCFGNTGQLVKMGKLFAEDFFIFDTRDTLPRQPVLVERSFEEEVTDALVLGIRDYCSKTGFNSVLLGLSGGIDSAIVAVLAAWAIGPENVYTVMLPSVYSSKGSITDSEKLIANTGIQSLSVSIQPVFEKLLEVLTPYFGGKPADVTEENLQSRTRGLYLMALSNKHGHLLLTTGNKSEVATGYATLYGDMCGALAVIADVYKTDIYALAEYLNREGEVIPRNIITKPPSAELRYNQTDQDSLPPYELLDRILKMYLEENMEVKEITSVVGEPETVKRILRLVDLNEFKRKQAAPALRVSYKAFGYGRRFPIVQRWSRE